MKKIILSLFVPLCIGLSLPVSAQQDTTLAKPKLAVLLVIDQMMPEFLSRFDKFYTGGFRRINDNAFVFDSGAHDHACTETGPGHATIGTGRHPSKNGIIANEWYDRKLDRSMYCVEDSATTLTGLPDQKGYSPRNIATDGLGDWLKKANPASKVISLSLKDRSAVGMGGQHPDAAVWWNRNDGNFVSSTYYDSILPAWVTAFNERRVFDSLRNKTWEKILPDSCYDLSTFDSFPGESNGPDLLNNFPHELTWDSANTKPFTRTYLYVSPFADEALLNLSKDAITVEQLGTDSIPDLLALSLSSSDAIGHTYGPNSQEIQDYYIRIDRKLGEFFSFLDSTVGAQSYVVALSADHGVLPLPEYLDMFGIPSERILTKTMDSDLEQIITRMESEGLGKKDWIKGNPQEVYLVADSGTTDSVKTAVINRLQNELKLLPYVADAYTRAQMMTKMQSPDPFLTYYRNSFFPARFADLIVRYKENNLMFASQYGTTHGTPYWYDRHVPLLFFGAGVTKGNNPKPARTVDISVTIAAMLKIKTPKDVDGESLLSAIHHQ